MTFLIPTAADWEVVLADWIQALRPGDFVLLRGDLAAGKTTFIQAVLKKLGLAPGSSPTYALHHRYQKGLLKIEHWDLYRLKSLEQLESTGFWDLIQDQESIYFIEWPDIVPSGSWPMDRKKYLFEIFKRGSGREVRITKLS